MTNDVHTFFRLSRLGDANLEQFDSDVSAVPFLDQQ